MSIRQTSLFLVILGELLCGALGAQAPRQTEIVVGTSLPLQAEGELIRRGIQAAFSSANAAGGVNGKFLRLLARDDRGSARNAYENIRSMYTETNLFLNIYTPGVVGMLLPDIVAGKLLVIAPESNASALYKPEHKHLIFTKPSVRSEIEALIEYVVQGKGYKKIAIFYVDDAGGESRRDVVREVLKKYNLTPIIEASHPTRTVDIGPAAQAIAAKQPDAVFCISGWHATYSFVLNAINRGLVHAVFMGTSYLLPIQKQLKTERGINFVATALVPNPEKSRLPLIFDYRRDLKKFYPAEPFSVISLAAYINASLFIELLRRSDGDVTMNKLIGSAEKITNFDFRGLPLNFDQTTRSLSHNIWLSPGYRQDWIALQKPIKETVIEEPGRGTL